jgi:hypothetical protein
MKTNPAYIARGSKASVSIVAAVVGLNGDRLVGRSWLVLSLDHPLVYVMSENRSQSGADAYRYLLSRSTILGVALDLIAFSGAVVLQIEHEVSANVLDSIYSIGGERHCVRCRSLVRLVR